MSSEPALSPIQPTAPDPEAADAEAQARPRFPWRLFFLLAAMMLAAALLILPYAIQLAAVGNPQIAERVPMVVGSTIIQVILLYLPMLLLGLLVSQRLDLGAPYLRAIVERRPAPPGFRRALVTAAGLGFGLGALLLVLAGAFSRLLPSELTSLSADQVPNAFQGFLASISAGINEEIMLRLFLLSLIAWLVVVLTKGSRGRPRPAVLWTANVLSAVIFGLLHLPNLLAMNVPVTPAALGYIILLNGLAGLGFGWLFWTFGLEAAMLAHFFTDIVLHVIGVLFT